MKKNDYKKDKIKSCVYTIEVDKGSPRKATIHNAHSSLLKYGSEYHYLFKKLHDFKEEPHLDVDHAYQVANYGRKLLEAFFSFKHLKFTLSLIAAGGRGRTGSNFAWSFRQGRRKRSGFRPCRIRQAKDSRCR